MSFSVRRFVSDEDGSPSVEFVIWLPIFVAVLALVVNSTLVMFEQSRMWDLARDAARQVAIGAMTEAQAETYLASQLDDADNYEIDVTDPGTSGSTVTAELSVHAQHLVLFGKTIVGKIFADGTVSARISMFKES